MTSHLSLAVAPPAPREVSRVIAQPYRALVVDDERVARTGLRLMLAAHPELHVVGEASNGVEAAAAIATLRPALVFLDIQMPDRDGFALLSQLPAEQRPAVVFVTAHRQYALDAFSISAIDYLLKPFSRDRLRSTVRRAVQFLAGADRETAPPETHHSRCTLSHVAAQLAPTSFIQISRSVIVNYGHVRSIRLRKNGQYQIVVEGGTAPHSSRRFGREVREGFGL